MGIGSNQFEVRLQPTTAPPTYSDLGIDKRDAHIWQTLATMPALGLLTVNALAAANGVIAPVLPAAADIRGLNLFLETLTTIELIN